jgi:predicted glycoside hydrolase/deacetylase ChbG (UPF0249 family)
MQLTIFDAMIYHHPHRPPVKYEPLNRHTIPSEEILKFISGQVERLTEIYGATPKEYRSTKSQHINPFHTN